MSTGLQRPLTGLRVVDQCDEKGEVAGRILADLGAEVIRIEPPDGAPSRRVPPFHRDTSLFFTVRNLGKKSQSLDLKRVEGRKRLEQLLALADVWLESHPPLMLAPLSFDPRSVMERHPRLVITSITDFGQNGPYRDYQATDAIIVAMSGLLFRSGSASKPPLLAPGNVAYDVCGTMAAFATLTALWQRERTGRGQHVDLSAMEAAAQTSDWALPSYSMFSALGSKYSEIRAGSGPIYSFYPCANGFVRLIILSRRQWRAMRAWLGEPEAVQDAHFDGVMGRIAVHADILDPLYTALFKDKTKLELASEAQRRGIALTPVLNPDEVLAAEHFIARQTFKAAEVADGLSGRTADGFFMLDGQRLGFTGRAPRVGEHNDEFPAANIKEAVGSSERRPASASERRPPFEGLRVLDFGIGGVGVETGRLFAEYGADVIKIETRTYPDFIRIVYGSEMSPPFASSSRCKRSLGVNVRTRAGLDIVKRLVALSDLVIENSSTGTMDDMGLGFEVLREINPRIVLASSQLMGSTGPWKSWIGFGPSTRPVGGMSYLWNFPGEKEPPGSSAILPDHLAGRALAVGALATMLARDRRGCGSHVEVAQVEVVIGLMADLLLKAALEPAAVSPQGNHSERGAPWGVYPCAGTERWCAITVRDDDDWRRLKKALGDPEWARNSAYDTVNGRIAARAEIDVCLGAWTAARVDREVMEILQRASVPAGLMMYASDMPNDPHLVARGYPQPIEQPGTTKLILEGPAFHATSMSEPLVKAAPALGEHTREVCRTLLKMDDAEISRLIAEGALEEPV